MPTSLNVGSTPSRTPFTAQGSTTTPPPAVTPAQLEAIYNRTYANGTRSHTEALKAVYDAGHAGARA